MAEAWDCLCQFRVKVLGNFHSQVGEHYASSAGAGFSPLRLQI